MKAKLQISEAQPAYRPAYLKSSNIHDFEFSRHFVKKSVKSRRVCDYNVSNYLLLNQEQGEFVVGRPREMNNETKAEGSTSQYFYKVEEACALLRIGKTKLYQEARDGRIMIIKIGRISRVPKASIDSYYENHIDNAIAFRRKNPGRWYLEAPIFFDEQELAMGWCS